MGNSNSYEVDPSQSRFRPSRRTTFRNPKIADGGNETNLPDYYSELQKAIAANDCGKVHDCLQNLDSIQNFNANSTAILFAACTCGNSEISSLVAEKHSWFDFCSQFSVTKSYPLHEAALRCDTLFFETLSRDPVFKEKYASDVKFTSMKDGEGNSLLHIAADKQAVNIVKFSLEFGLDPLARNLKGVTPLHFAAMRGSEIIARLLLESDKVPDVKSYIGREAIGVCCETPLYFAAKFNHPKMIEFLLKRYSEAGGEEQLLIEHKTTLGFTPLLSAVRFTNPKCVTMLLAKNARVLAKDTKRSSNALLWAVVVQSPTIIKEILSHVQASPSDTDSMKFWIETDPNGNTAHHLAAETSNMAVLETLVSINKTCLEIKNKDGLTPLHTGAKIGKQEVVNFIISNAPGTTYSSDNNGNSVLHIAAERGHEALVECLMDTHNFGLIVCARNSSHGKTPLHLAAQNGHYSVLAFLLHHQQTPDTAIEITDNKNCTALYLACKEGHAKCVEVLLKGGAKVTYYTHDQCEIKSCLEIAILRLNRAVISVILRSPSWRHALRVCYPPHPKLERNAVTVVNTPLTDNELQIESRYNTTPFRELIKTMPDLAMVVLDKCRKEYDSGAREYNYEFLEDFSDLYMEKNCPKFNDGINVVSVNERQHRPLSQTMSQSRVIAGTDTDHHQPTGQPCRNEPWGPGEYYYWNHPLQLMVEHQRERLLNHPVVKTFIRRKWYYLGAWIFYFNVLMYATLMILLTAYMHLHFDLTMSLQKGIDIALSNCSANMDITIISQEDKLRKQFMITLACIIVIICLMRIIVELFQLTFYSGEYLTSWINLIEGFLYVGTITFVLSDFEYTCLNSWRWQLGALCIFLSWINFVLFMSKEPTFGIYVVMFQEVLKTFLKTIPMSTLLIFAFGQPFYMLLSPVVVENMPGTYTAPFDNLGYTLLKTVTMTIGEFDEVDHILYRVPSSIEFQFSTYLLWLTFVIVMAILLQNMLVGLAVDNIKGVLAKAALEKEALQIEFLLKLTNIKCFRYLTRRFNSPKGQRKVWRGWKWCRTQMITFSFFRGRDDDIQHHRCLRSRSYMPSKDPIEVVMQKHFQRVEERCDRLEKLILKQIIEQKYHQQQQNERDCLGMRSRTISALSVDDDGNPSTIPGQGFLNELYHESSPGETESEA